MKTKIIPFDLELEKKIQAGEIEGKIKTRSGLKARIVCTDVKRNQPMIITTTQTSVSRYTEIYSVIRKRSSITEMEGCLESLTIRSISKENSK